MLPRREGCIDQRLTSSETTRAVGSAEAAGAERLGPYTPNPDRHRDFEGPGVSRSRGCGAVRATEGTSGGEVAKLLEPYGPKANKQRGHEGRGVGLRRRLPSSEGCIDRGLTSRETTRTVGSAETLGADKLGLYFPKVDMQRGHEGRGVGLSLTLPRSWGRRGLRLTSSEATRAVVSSKAEASEHLGLYRSKADKQRCHGLLKPRQPRS